jgi:hypothetical protein
MKLSPNALLLFPAAYSNLPLPITLPSLLRNDLPFSSLRLPEGRAGVSGAHFRQ